MAKEKKHQPSEKTSGKPVSPAQGSSSGLFSRNLIIIAVLSIIFLGIYKLNDFQGEFMSLRAELQALEQSPQGNGQRLDEVRQRLHEISADTGYFRTLFVGYYADVHNVAFGFQTQIDKALEEIKSQRERFHLEYSESVTREDKLRLKVNTYILMERINEYTPRNSVILLPPADSLANDDEWRSLSDPIWVEYFIYPRLCIATGTESKYPELAKRVSYVLIVKGIGYNKLKYNVPLEKREQLSLLPVNEPADSTQNLN